MLDSVVTQLAGKTDTNNTSGFVCMLLFFLCKDVYRYVFTFNLHERLFLGSVVNWNNLSSMYPWPGVKEPTQKTFHHSGANWRIDNVFSICLGADSSEVREEQYKSLSLSSKFCQNLSLRIEIPGSDKALASDQFRTSVRFPYPSARNRQIQRSFYLLRTINWTLK